MVTIMGKYDPLAAHLEELSPTQHDIELTFSAIERLCGSLPPSAWKHRPWWANGSKVQAKAWRNAGWHVDAVDQTTGVVRFARGRVGGSYAARLAGQISQDSTPPPSPHRSAEPRTGPSNTEWFWEGNVVAALARHLQANGWTIQSVADTATKQHGVDLIAAQGPRRLLIEAKGYPSKSYSDPRRAQERKRTSPTTQAGHWLSSALSSAMKHRDVDPGAEIAVALPDFSRYRKLLRARQRSLIALRFDVYLIAEDDSVQHIPPDGLAGL